MELQFSSQYRHNGLQIVPLRTLNHQVTIIVSKLRGTDALHFLAKLSFDNFYSIEPFSHISDLAVFRRNDADFCLYSLFSRHCGTA